MEYSQLKPLMVLHWDLFITSSMTIKQQWLTLDHWACPSNSSPKDSGGFKKQHVKKTEWNYKKNFLAPFYGWVQLLEDQSHFEEAVYFITLKVPKNSWYSFYQPRKDKRLSRPWSHPMVLTMRLQDWESSTLATRSLRLNPSFRKCWIEKKENNTVCSSINLPSNLVNNVFASVHYLGFNIKLLFFFT